MTVFALGQGERVRLERIQKRFQQYSHSFISFLKKESEATITMLTVNYG